MQKLHSEVGVLRRRLAGTENTHAKQVNSQKEQIAGLKSKLALTERDLIDSHIQCAPCIPSHKLLPLPARVRGVCGAFETAPSPGFPPPACCASHPSVPMAVA